MALLSEGLTVSSALEIVVNEYEVDQDTVSKDLSKLLQDLEENKLIILEHHSHEAD